MIKNSLPLLTFILTLWISGAQLHAQTKVADPFTISGFQSQQAQGWSFTDSKGRRQNMKFFKVGLRINDPTLTSIETACIYLYDKDKALIFKLTEIEPKGKNLDGTKVNFADFPNMISDLNDLKANVVYYLVFPYSDEVKWKTAVVVLGTKDQVMVDALPASAKPQDFEFKEKDKLVKSP